ncbi:MAG: type II toxin-antitoxin system ParD family antitoxin [Myxococcales bacterium]|nr:type II toxin-antitoxin system ParD family antitoxin [Myxococcales bacterium]
MSRNTSVVLSERLQEFIREQVDSGEYRSASEVVREALERLADDSKREAALLAALDEGLSSGRAKAGVFDRVRRKTRAQ